MTVKMFLFAVLGSNIFWIVAALISLIGSAVTMKKIAPVTYVWLTEGEEEAKSKGHEPRRDRFDKGFSIMLAFVCIFFWWLIVISYIIYYVFMYFFKLVGLIVKGIFKTIDKIIPNVSIRVERND